MRILKDSITITSKLKEREKKSGGQGTFPRIGNEKLMRVFFFLKTAKAVRLSNFKDERLTEVKDKCTILFF